MLKTCLFSLFIAWGFLIFLFARIFTLDNLHSFKLVLKLCMLFRCSFSYFYILSQYISRFMRIYSNLIFFTSPFSYIFSFVSFIFGIILLKLMLYFSKRRKSFRTIIIFWVLFLIVSYLFNLLSCQFILASLQVN